MITIVKSSKSSMHLIKLCITFMSFMFMSVVALSLCYTSVVWGKGLMCLVNGIFDAILFLERAIHVKYPLFSRPVPRFWKSGWDGKLWQAGTSSFQCSLHGLYDVSIGGAGSCHQVAADGEQFQWCFSTFGVLTRPSACFRCSRPHWQLQFT